MAITKTIQATVKNRTDTAANWTQKNPVLAEGEIIVVQTSAGETRLKIGDGVKTFTQLPYTDEQIYNNVVTSVNGQTGDVTLPGDFIVTATLTDDTNCTLDKTFAQIQEAIQSGKRVLANISGFLSTCMPLVLYSSGAVLFGATTTTSGNIELYTLAVTANEAKFVSKEAVTYGPDSTMPQVSMDSDPTADMQIATKKYVDDHVSADVYVDFWPTGSGEQYNGNFNGYQIELATDQTFDAIFDSFNAGNKIVARLYKDAEKSELAASSVDASVTGTKEFGAIHFQFVTANADTGAIAGFPFIGEAIMMIKWEEAAVSYLIENRNVLPTPNTDGTDNGKAPIINGTKWELKTPTVAQEQLTGTTHNLTPTQAYEAISAGTPVKVQYTDSTYGLLSFTAFNVAETLNKVVSQTIAYYNGVYIFAELYGNKTDNRWYFVSTTLAQKADIPTALPNPNALTFTGAVTGSYDGSAPISVNIPTVPTKTSQLTNDSGFLTSHQDISGKQDKATLEADVAAKGFTKNTGTYSKPAGGIPKSDLDAAVQTSLGKADTALQEHQSLAAYRTAAAQDEIDSGKVDKVTGKGLSTNDYTASAKAKVDAIPANPKYTDTVYDDTAINERVATIEGKESAWDAKSDFSGSYNDLTDKPTIPTALPNPNAITFTGAVTGSYDGSEPVTINIPESGAGNMKKLTFTGAVTGEYDGTTDVSIDIPIATASTAGIIKVGNGLSISADGTLSVTTATYYTGTADPVNTLGADGDLYLKTEG